MFIESIDTPITCSTINARIDQLANKDSLIPTLKSEVHMARIDLLDFEVIIYGSDIVNELRTFLHKKAEERIKQLLSFDNKSQQNQ